MIRSISFLTAMLMAGSVLAQAPHFDMSPEAEQFVRAEPSSAPQIEVPVPVVVPPDLIRYLLPEGTIRLVGENDRRDYQIYVSAAQAEAAAVLHLGYLNALVVAPESSRLRVEINGSAVLTAPISSSAEIGQLAADIPPGVLKVGFNRISIRADQRHRTDCDIGSTYELWSELSAPDTYLSFTGRQVGQLSRLSDLAAAGWNQHGVSILRIVSPAGSAARNDALTADLVQTLALTMRAANAQVEYVSEVPAHAEPGVLTVLMAPFDQLPANAGALAGEARSNPVAAFAGDAANTLVLSGPSWDSVRTALDDVRLVATQYPQFPNSLPPRADRATAAPILMGSDTVTFAEMGFEGLSFNGRRYRTEFSFALPADFYANKYGQSLVTLKAAYSGDVRPGSQIDVFVNGQIASVTPILRTNEALLDLPIKVPMSAFRPGVNKVEIVAALRTEADDLCAPGTVTVSTDQRLLISSDSTFSMPEFARISQVPNLSAFANSGFPYEDGSTAQLVVGSGEDSLPAAMTFLARLAGQTNNIVPVKSVTRASPPPDQDAIFVGAYAQLPPDAIQRVGVLQPYATDDDVMANETSDINAILQRWRSTANANDTSLVSRFQHWIADLLNLGPNSLGVLPPDDEPYAPRLSDKALVSQRLQPEGGLWTMLTVPDNSSLASGIGTITRASLWPQLSGRISVVPEDQSAVETIEPNRVSFFESSPWTFQNLRNILANWLSSHVLAYALGLCLVLIGLTLATSKMLNSLGRRH
jgi:hypothetical protein